jgi:glycosyltransferase involved in cell wall biosynthesis
MKVVVAVLTYNRIDLFGRTTGSLKRTAYPYERIVVDNGSTDGTVAATAKMGGKIILNVTGNPMIGYGFRLATEAALEFGPDLIVFSGDDFEYRQGWLERLVAFWRDAPKTVALCGMHLETVYRWSAIRGAIEFGGQRGLVRDSLPGASWSFRPALWDQIKDLVHDDSHRYDRAVCRRLREHGRLLVALPLSEHKGHGRRMWETGPEALGTPIDRKRWRI